MDFKDIKVFDITKSIALIVAILVGWYYVSQGINIFKESNNLTKQILTLENTVANLSNIKANDDIAEKMVKSLDKRDSKILELFEKNKSSTKETLDEIGILKAELAQTRNIIDTMSDKSYKNPTKNKMDYEFIKIYAKDAEGKKFPIAWAMYFPNREEGKRWKKGTYLLEYYTNIIESENKDSTFNRYAEMYIENNQMKETRGKSFPIKMKDIKWSKIERSNKSFNFWNPRLSLSINSNLSEIFPALNLSLMSYGKTNCDMDWKFLSFGLGASKVNDELRGFLMFEPLSWNIGLQIPLIENFFVGPIVTFNTDSEVNYGMSGSIPF